MPMPREKKPNAHLSLVPAPIGDSEVYDLMRKPETPAERIKRLQLEAQLLAREQIEELSKELEAVARKAELIAQGGEAYPVGARELCRSLIEDIDARAKTLKAIVERTSR